VNLIDEGDIQFDVDLPIDNTVYFDFGLGVVVALQPSLFECSSTNSSHSISLLFWLRHP